MVVCSESDSSSSSDSKEHTYDALFDGEYTSADFPAGFSNSICTAENGNIYGAAGPMIDDPGQNRINIYGRSTQGVLEVSDGVYQAEFDAFQFVETGSTGVRLLAATMTYYESTDRTTFSFSGGPTFNFTKEADKGKRCIIPDGNWNDAIEEFPFNVVNPLTSEECPADVANCAAIVRFEEFPFNVDGGACFATYDTDNNAFVNEHSGLLVNAQIMWGGELMIYEWRENDESGFCHIGTQMSVWINEEEVYSVFAKCGNEEFGRNILFYREADVLEEIEDATCPLYKDTSAKTMFRNDDEYHENGYKVETIVIDFSNTSIGTVWAILIVFTSVTVVMCWCLKRKKIENDI